MVKSKAKRSPKKAKTSSKSSDICHKELNAVKSARSAASKNAAATRLQKCYINRSNGRIHTGLKLSKKDKEKLKEGKKI
jgi:hypothetical protein